MQWFHEFFLSEESRGRWVSSLILLISIALIRLLAINAVRTSKARAEGKRKWVVQIKNFSMVILILGLIVIWASELRNFAISLVAIAAAIAISTKEIILCFMGGMYKASVRAFEIGDRIQVGEFRGDVLDHDLLSTRLFEIGPGADMHQFTGKVITIPNALFLSNSILNESKAPFDLHTFKVPIPPGPHWKDMEKQLYEACYRECSPYLAEAKRYMTRVQEKEGIDVPDLDPRISLHPVDVKEWHLVVRIPVRGLRKARSEQAILRDFFENLKVWPYEDPTSPVLQPEASQPAE